MVIVGQQMWRRQQVRLSFFLSFFLSFSFFRSFFQPDVRVGNVFLALFYLSFLPPLFSLFFLACNEFVLFIHGSASPVC